MVRTVSTVVLSVVFSLLAAALLLPALAPEKKEGFAGDPLKKQLECQQQKVWKLVVEDIEKHGADIYKVFIDSTQHLRRGPDSDFGSDKSLKKLEVAYPESNSYKMPLAWKHYNAIAKRDILCIEKVISEIPPRGEARLLPNGLELEPHLHAAMFNYHLNRGKYKIACGHLKKIEEQYGNSLICVSGNDIVAARDWIALQKKILKAIEKYRQKGAL